MEIRKLRIGNLLLPSNVLMAPLAGYTCYPFRLLAYEMRAGLLLYGDGKRECAEI